MFCLNTAKSSGDNRGRHVNVSIYTDRSDEPYGENNLFTDCSRLPVFINLSSSEIADQAVPPDVQCTSQDTAVAYTPRKEPSSRTPDRCPSTSGSPHHRHHQRPFTATKFTSAFACPMHNDTKARVVHNRIYSPPSCHQEKMLYERPLHSPHHLQRVNLQHSYCELGLRDEDKKRFSPSFSDCTSLESLSPLTLSPERIHRYGSRSNDDYDTWEEDRFRIYNHTQQHEPMHLVSAYQAQLPQRRREYYA